MSSSSKTSGSVATPAKPQTGAGTVPHEKIAMLAYAKWQQRGCPCGTHMQDWHEAETELKAEMMRGKSTSAPAPMPAKSAQQRR